MEHKLIERGRMDLVSTVEHVAGLGDFFYARQKEPLGLGDAVLAAERHVSGEPFALLLPDDVIRADPPCLAQLLAVHAEHPDACVVAVVEVEPGDVKRYGVVKTAGGTTDHTFSCADVVEKPPVGSAPSNLAVVGRYILPPDIFPRLRMLGPGAGGEIQLTDALATLAREGRLLACRFQGERWDTGDPAGHVAGRRQELPACRRPPADVAADSCCGT